MHEGNKVSEFCYSFKGGDYYTNFFFYGWAIVMMCGNGEGYTLSHAEH